jgi:hypothetical protein
MMEVEVGVKVTGVEVGTTKRSMVGIRVTVG